MRVVNWIFSLIKKKSTRISLSPLAWVFDTVYKEGKGAVPTFPFWVSSPEDCKWGCVSENIGSGEVCYFRCPDFESVFDSNTFWTNVRS